MNRKLVVDERGPSDGDGVALFACEHPTPPASERVYWGLVRFWRWLTWPIRKYRVVETAEIEIIRPPV